MNLRAIFREPWRSALALCPQDTHWNSACVGRYGSQYARRPVSRLLCGCRECIYGFTTDDFMDAFVHGASFDALVANIVLICFWEGAGVAIW